MTMPREPDEEKEKKVADDGQSWGTFAWCVVAAFGVYFCMYAFRKPYTAAEFKGDPLAGIELKSLCVISQMLGYTCSKFIGIKTIAEALPQYRVGFILALIAAGEVALLLF